MVTAPSLMWPIMILALALVAIVWLPEDNNVIRKNLNSLWGELHNTIIVRHKNDRFVVLGDCPLMSVRHTNTIKQRPRVEGL